MVPLRPTVSSYLLWVKFESLCFLKTWVPMLRRQPLQQHRLSHYTSKQSHQCPLYTNSSPVSTTRGHRPSRRRANSRDSARGDDVRDGRRAVDVGRDLRRVDSGRDRWSRRGTDEWGRGGDRV